MPHHPAPSTAARTSRAPVVTPTRVPGLRAALARYADRLTLQCRDALRRGARHSA